MMPSRGCGSGRPLPETRLLALAVLPDAGGQNVKTTPVEIRALSTTSPEAKIGV